MQKLLFTLPVVAAALAAAPDCRGSEPQSDKLNVIYILADDMGYGDLSCYGQKHFKTENLDRMAAEGMLFTQHYAGSTVSAPSRSALMTGQHTGHTPIRGNKEIKGEGQIPLPANTYTLGQMFKSAGYTTGAFGKWGLGYPGSEGDPTNQGFDEFFGYNCQRAAHRYYPGHLWHNKEKVILKGNDGIHKVVYSQDLIHQKAMEFLAGNKDKPFFMFLPYVIPHAELLVPEDDILARYRNQFTEQPYVGQPGSDYGPDMITELYCSQQEPYATFAAMMTRLDKYVGEILEELRRQGLDKNTIVVFTSDNGPHREGGANPDMFSSYGPFRGIKRDMYEGGIRVPMIAWCPGKVVAGEKSDQISAFWDMMPTFAEFAGTKVPSKAQCDGISLVPTLFGQKGQKQHDYLYWEFHEQGGKIAVRQGNWKLIKLNVLQKKNKPVKTELYDLSKDIHEDHNVADEYPDVVKKLEKIMQKAREESDTFTFKQPSKYI